VPNTVTHDDLIADALGDSPALLTFAAAAERTGIPAPTWHRWVRQGLVRVIRPCGGHPRLPRAEIARVLREGRSPREAIVAEHEAGDAP
jgi:excisionase family DNA binding protein